MKIFVTGRSGTEKAFDAIEGWRVMEIIRDHGQRDPDVAIKAECGGALACATCHVRVAEDWLGRLTPRQEEELEMLDSAFGVDERSRLSCQIIMTEALDGLRVEIAPGTEP